MDQLKIIELLQPRDRNVAKATRFCPSDQFLAAFCDGVEKPASREAFEHHLTGCKHCRARLGVVAQVLQDLDPVTIPERLMKQAIGVGLPESRYPAWRIPATAAAALAIMAIFLVQYPASKPGVSRPELIATSPPRTQRNIEHLSPTPAILTPINGSRVQPGDLQIRWTQVPGSLYYDIRLLDAAGFIVWENRLTGTQSALPEKLPLVAGERYFVRVDAYLAEAKSVGSSHISFTIGGSEQ